MHYCHSGLSELKKKNMLYHRQRKSEEKDTIDLSITQYISFLPTKLILHTHTHTHTHTHAQIATHTHTHNSFFFLDTKIHHR